MAEKEQRVAEKECVGAEEQKREGSEGETAVQTLRQWLEAEPFALGMSSGFFGFYAHCGMLSVLEEEGLWPVRLSGSSAGALVAGCWASGLSASQIREELFALRRADFWDPGWGWGLLRGRLFRRRLETLLPVSDFAACRVPLAVSVHLLGQGPEVVQQGELAPAIHASCAVPLLFHPIKIGEKTFCDGGVSDRPGLLGVPQGDRLFFHHLASRSPWRRPNSPSLRVPDRPNMTTLICQDLPRVSPFRLERGREAFDLARRATQRALDLPRLSPVLQS